MPAGRVLDVVIIYHGYAICIGGYWGLSMMAIYYTKREYMVSIIGF